MPQWLNEAVFYEIYPQSFNDTNADGIGDLKGITEKLDYIKDLGCNAVWINPCFTSPFLDAGYDVSDYYHVAPRYGTNEDMQVLIDEMHQRGMHLLLDLVPGHTSLQHPWFKQSMLGTKNEYTDRYIWTDSVWKSWDKMSCIRGFSERDGACVVNFFSHQPALNYGFYQTEPNETWQQSMNDEGPQKTLQAMIDIMRFWLDMGCDGFRVDMAGSLVKNDPEAKGTIQLWQKVRKIMDQEYPEAALISEWGEPDKSLASGFHMDFLLHFGPSHYNDLFRCDEPYFSSRGKGDISEFVHTYEKNYQKTNGKGLICIPSGNHDMDRLSRRLHGDELKIAYAFLLSMPGAPFIYYGDEIGMHFIDGLQSVEGGYYRTGSRTPMQWNSRTNKGFSAGSADQLYLPVDQAEDAPTVEKQLADSASLLHEVMKLIYVRKNHPALQNTASIEFLPIDKNQYPLVYLRKSEEENAVIMINPSRKPHQFSCSHQLKERIYNFNGDITIEGSQISILGNTAAFYTIE